MRIKGMIAGFLAGILMMGSLSPVCYAAGADGRETAAGPAGSTADGTDGSGQEAGTGGSGNAGGSDSPSLPEGFTLGKEIELPEGVAIDGDGNISISLDGWNLGMADGGDGGTEKEETETAGKTVSIGTVNVSADTWLNLRSGSGMEHPVIGHLLRGMEVEVIGGSGDWYEVVVPEAKGYVHRDYLDVEERTVPVPGTGGGSAGGIDEKSLMMLLSLMMGGMGNMGGGAAESPSASLTPDGNLTLVDDYGTENADGSGKQFITLVTKAGNTFYLVIDRDDKGEQNVHFLNLVDEADLLALTDGDGASKQGAPEPEVQPPAVTPEPEPAPDAEKAETGEPAPKSSPVPVLILALVLLGGGGFLAYVKLFRGRVKKERAKPDPDADYLDDDGDYGLPEDEGSDRDYDLPEDGDGFDAEDDEPV